MKVAIDEVEYDLETLDEKEKGILKSYNFALVRVLELKKRRALLSKAKKSYIDSLEKEILAKKAGLFINDD